MVSSRHRVLKRSAEEMERRGSKKCLDVNWNQVSAPILKAV